MDESSQTNSLSQNRTAYQSQQNWVHPKKFELLKALKHKNQNGNRLQSLSVSKFPTQQDVLRDTRYCKFDPREKRPIPECTISNFNTQKMNTGSDFYVNGPKKKRDAFSSNYSKKKPELPDSQLSYRTIFPTARSHNPQLDGDFTATTGNTRIFKKIERFIVDKEQLCKTRRHFHPPKGMTIRQSDRQEY